jgi:tetratricopeptide (TPR) repeat protein
MIRLFFCLLLSVFSLTAYSQSFAEWLGKGAQLYEQKSFQASAEAYDQAIALQPDISGTVYYNAACSWALAGNPEKALDRLEDAIEKGWIDVNWTQKDTDLTSLHALPRWATIIADLQKKSDAYEAGLNKPLMAELRQIQETDQKYRMMMDSIEQEFGWESKEMQELWKKQSDADSINLQKIEAIIAEHGYPGKSLVGNRLANATFLVIQHADLEIQEKYLPILQAAADKGELRKSSLALLIDRIEMRNDRPQIYGSQVIRNEETGNLEPYTIKDPEQVDKRRAEVGLGPLKDYLARFGIK